MAISINDLAQFSQPEITIDFNGKEIKVKKYISEAQRINIANNITSIIMRASDSDDSNFSAVDFKNSIYITLLIGNYTNINIGELNYINISDMVISTGLYEKILEIIPSSEIKLLTDAIDFNIEQKKFEILLSKLDEIKAESIETQLSRFLQMAIDKIPSDKKIQSLMKSVAKQFNQLDPDKLKFINDKVKEFGGKDVPTTETVNNIANVVSDFVGKKKTK